MVKEKRKNIKKENIKKEKIKKDKIKKKDAMGKPKNNAKNNEKWFIRELKKVPLFRAIYKVNDSKYFAGFIMIILNIGSKYVVVNLSKTQEDYLKNTIGRQILIFSIAWMGTRDIFTALIITALFYLMTVHLFNEKSKFCIIPQKWRKYEDVLDLNGDGKVTENEIKKAKQIIEKAKKEGKI